jgi:hypothetical protein
MYSSVPDIHAGIFLDQGGEDDLSANKADTHTSMEIRLAMDIHTMGIEWAYIPHHPSLANLSASSFAFLRPPIMRET